MLLALVNFFLLLLEYYKLFDHDTIDEYDNEVI